MDVVISSSPTELGRRAATDGAELIQRAVDRQGHATIIVATGASQFQMLDTLTATDLPWHRVTAFHLDEYVGLPITHPASFRAYLWQRFVRRLPLPLAAFHYIDGQADPVAECARLAGIIQTHTVDVAFVGIGENAHLAFNDPPADFATDAPYLSVTLDDACKKQQLGEGWFASISEVPDTAISMSCQQILRSQAIVCSVPDARKAAAVRAAVEGPVTPEAPASILQRHPHARLYLDLESSKLLSRS